MFLILMNLLSIYSFSFPKLILGPFMNGMVCGSSSSYCMGYLLNVMK